MGPNAPCSTGLDTAGVSSNSLLSKARNMELCCCCCFAAVETRLGVAARVLGEGLKSAKTTQSDGGQQLRVLGLEEPRTDEDFVCQECLCVPSRVLLRRLSNSESEEMHLASFFACLFFFVAGIPGVRV